MLSDDGMLRRYELFCRTGRNMTEQCVRRHLRYVEAWQVYLGDKDVAQADTDDAVAWVDSLHQAPATVAQGISCLRLFYAWGCSKGAWTVNPFFLIRRPPEERKIPKTLKPEQVERILHALPKRTFRDIRDTAVLHVLYATGARASEVCALDVGDIDTKAGTVLLRGKRRAGQRQLKERTAYLRPEDARAVEAYLRWARPVHADRTSPLFVGIHGDRIGRSLVRNILQRACKAAKLGPVNPHRLRHSFACHLRDAGAPLEDVQHLLGHEKIQTTEIYARASDPRLRDTYRRCFERTAAAVASR